MIECVLSCYRACAYMHIHPLICHSHRFSSARRRCRLKGHPLRVNHKQDWNQGFNLTLPQAAVLPEPDAGSDGVKLASGFVIQNYVVLNVWGTLLERGLPFVQGRRICNLVKERDPICAWTNGIAQIQSAGD